MSENKPNQLALHLPDFFFLKRQITVYAKAEQQQEKFSTLCRLLENETSTHTPPETWQLPEVGYLYNR